MADGIRSYVARVTDPVIQQALRLIGDRLASLETLFKDLDARVLKTGSPVEAYGQRIRDLADPQRSTDAVNLQTLRRYVQSALMIERGVPPRPTRDAGALPTYPAPTGTFTATPNSLGAPGNVTFDWTTQHTTSVESSLHGPLALSGSIVSFVSTSFTTTLTLRGPGGVTTYQLTVTVAATPPPTPTPTGTFQAIPSTVAPGQSSTLAWTSTNATAASINQGVGVVTPVAAGNVIVAPAQTTQYELRLTGPGGTQILQTTVVVSAAPPPPPPPGSTNAGLLTWGFSNNGLRFFWKGYSAFSLFHDALDPARAATSAGVVDYFGARGCTVPRVFLTQAGNPFEANGFRLYPPERSNFFTVLPQFVEYLNARGQIPELVIFAAFVEIWGTDFEAMREFVRQVARALLPYRGAFVQIANEWNQIGFTAASQLVTLGNDYRAIDPTRPLTLSAPNGPGDQDTSPNVAPPASYFTAHVDRVVTPNRFDWIIRHFGHPTMANGRVPAVSDEPINAGYAFGRTDNEPDPQYWYAFGAMGQLMGWSGTFHYDGGLFNQIPGPGSAEEHCLTAWLLGQGYPSPDSGGTLFAALPSGVAFGPSPWATSGTNRGLIGRTTAGGTAYALCFGAGALPATSAGWQPAQVDGFTVGLFLPPGFPAGAFSEIRGYVARPAGL